MRDGDVKARLARILQSASQTRREIILSPEQQARLAGETIWDEKRLKSSIGTHTVRKLKPKRDMHPALLCDWRQQRKERKKASRIPFTGLSLAITSCFDDIANELGLEVQPSTLLGANFQRVLGPAEAFDPYRGLVWYALKIESLYKNARTHVRAGNSEIAAYYGFQLGITFTEFHIMRGAGEFIEQSRKIKESQRDAGRASEKIDSAARRQAYFKYVSKGDKRTHAAENAAAELGVSTSTIRNAFENSRLPKKRP